MERVTNAFQEQLLNASEENMQRASLQKQPLYGTANYEVLEQDHK